ncbi:MAG TPA: MarR family transcriptional regulator [Clostridia bacterium]|nr:MarR family transcriptional regulator [Clostridia bacterium]
MDIRSELNKMLVETYRNIVKVEEQMMDRHKKLQLSIGEVHMIEAIGSANGRTITEIANELDITLPTVTITVARLEKKGFVQRKRISDDRRLVHVFLTETGEKVNRIHRSFHRKMIDSLVQGFTEEEERIMLTGLKRLNEYFKLRVKKSED